MIELRPLIEPMKTKNDAKWSLLGKLCILGFMITGGILYREHAPASWGNSAEHGVSLTHALGAGIAGGIGAIIGIGLVMLIKKIRSKS
jgi:hypothetical protein